MSSLGRPAVHLAQCYFTDGSKDAILRECVSLVVVTLLFMSFSVPFLLTLLLLPP